MRKVWLHCVLWSLPTLVHGIDVAGADLVPSVNGAHLSRARVSPAPLATDRAAPGSDCRLPAAQPDNRSDLRSIAYAAVAAPRSRDGAVAEVEIYARLHRQARSDVPFEWRPLVGCDLP